MKTICLHPGQIHASHQRAGTQFIAIDGALRLIYRDPSLDWLMELSPLFRVDLNAGDAHVFSCNAWVEIDVIGETTTVGVLTSDHVINRSIENLSAWLKKKTHSAFVKA
ncbi:hypothetical protein ASG35_22890 [Burkholderia sp. Leaf177]|uniref:hypothetical protein n=1 Tax=Burkholderia sp. Leaf177 TaxID=1736287 RepID=UPI0006FF451F|nr:hypothetical protein [Burkholderia sp. Leaf177]KQR73809.1 hypothetical protein ASG35_22890 [Burkholderia sp. Leaf177]